MPFPKYDQKKKLTLHALACSVYCEFEKEFVLVCDYNYGQKKEENLITKSLRLGRENL